MRNGRRRGMSLWLMVSSLIISALNWLNLFEVLVEKKERESAQHTETKKGNCSELLRTAWNEPAPNIPLGKKKEKREREKTEKHKKQQKP